MAHVYVLPVGKMMWQALKEAPRTPLLIGQNCRCICRMRIKGAELIRGPPAVGCSKKAATGRLGKVLGSRIWALG